MRRIECCLIVTLVLAGCSSFRVAPSAPLDSQSLDQDAAEAGLQDASFDHRADAKRKDAPVDNLHRDLKIDTPVEVVDAKSSDQRLEMQPITSIDSACP